MTYKEALEYIDSFLVFGSKLGFERIENLLNLLGNPQKKLKFIHVAGTNGKGSVCSYISNVLISAGYKTGMFVSPYVIDYCERFQINNRPIPHDELCQITEEVKQAADTVPESLVPTEFEIVTAIGLLWFMRQKCDVVVLEVGLGGKYDATNIIDTPLCSVITSISLDHTRILGDTVEKIAVQKAGIIKPSGKTVMYPLQTGGVEDIISQTAHDNGNEFIVPNTNDIKITEKSAFGTSAEYKGMRFSVGIAGDKQVYNAVTAIEAVFAAFPSISKKAVVDGIKNASLPARCQIIEKSRPVILDGGHNPDGVKSLANFLDGFIGGKKTAVIGMMKDKDVNTVLSELAVRFDKIITVTVNNPRTMTAVELHDIAKKYCKDVIAADSMKSAAELAFANDGAVVVCGSFYLIGEIYPYLQKYLSV